MIHIRANGDRLFPARFRAGTAGSYHERIMIDFSEEWSNLLCKIVFYPVKGKPISVIWTKEAAEKGIKIPCEAMKYSGNAKFIVSGYRMESGLVGEKIVSLTGIMEVDATLSDNVNEMGIPPTPSAYEQLRDDMVGEIHNTLKNAKESGEFDGKSAYELATDEGYRGNIPEWLESLKGKDGVSITRVTINDEGELIIEYSDHGTAKLGVVVGDDGITPHIGENNNWFIGDVDTGIKATADDRAVLYTSMGLSKQQKSQARENIDAANEIAITATGEEIVITDAAEQPLRDLFILGKSRQIRTPSTDAHATISSVGSVGFTEVSFNDEFFIFPIVEGGLRGIPVADNGNYTDERGQQWVADEIRYTNDRAVHTRRIGRIVLDGNSEIRFDHNTRFFFITVDGLLSPSPACLCNAFIGSAYGTSNFEITVTNNALMIRSSVFKEDADALKQYLTQQSALGTPVEVLYILSESVETVLPMDVDYLEYLVLTDEENVIFSGEGAGLSVEYTADTKKYVDQHGGGGGSGGIAKETDPTVPAWAKQPNKPAYTADEVGALPADTAIPAKTSELTNDSGFITVAVATLLNYYLKTETYAKTETYSQTEVDNLIDGLDKRLAAIADSDDTTLDQLSEIVAYIKTNKSLIDNITTAKVNVSDIINNLTTADSKKPLSAAQGKELKTLYDSLPSWAKQPNKPAYTADEVGALPADTAIPAKTSELTNDSGFITVAVATLLNYYLKTETYAKTETYSQTEVDNLIDGLDKRLAAIADSDDTTLDQLSEIVAYIKTNKSLIDNITTAKVNVSDIINNLTTADSKKPLSAAQGKELKTLYDSLPSWAKAATKPSYSKSEVGLGNVDNVKQYSANNPPPYPVTKVNGKTGAVILDPTDLNLEPITITGVDADGTTHTWILAGWGNNPA